LSLVSRAGVKIIDRSVPAKKKDGGVCRWYNPRYGELIPERGVVILRSVLISQKSGFKLYLMVKRITYREERNGDF